MTKKDKVLGRPVNRILAGILAVGLLLAASEWAPAQEGSWSAPVMISTNTLSSWFPDVAVDGGGRPHIVWNSGRPFDTEQGRVDLLMYSALVDQSWLEPNDIAVPSYGAYTIRPAIAVDSAGALHVTFRGYTTIYYIGSSATEAWRASSWTSPKAISGAGAGTAYYSDVAVDEQGGIHVVWNESVSAGVDERWLWFGTLRGGAIYDGIGWRFQEPQTGLGNREIHAVIENESGIQWFGTDDGVYRFDGHGWQKLGLTGQQVSCVAQDADGGLWFGTDQGVSRYSEDQDGNGEWIVYTARDGLPDNRVRAIAIDRQGRVWVGTDKGLVSYDGQNWTSYFPLPEVSTAEVLAIAIDAQDDVWVGTKQGVKRYDGQNWTTYAVGSGLLGNVVTAIATDRGGAIWFGTDSGLSRFDGQEWTSYSTGEGLLGSVVTALMVDSKGTLWVATEEGVSHYDGRTWETLGLPQEFAGQKITVIAEDQQVNVMCPMCGDIFYRHSVDGGMGWSTPINLSNSFAGSVKPQVRVGSQGNVYVTWEEGEDWYAHRGYPVASMYIHSSDGGTTWDEPTVFSFARGAPQQMTLGVGQEGNLVVVWRPPAENLYYYQFSTDGGASWSKPDSIPGVIAKPWESFSLDGYDAVADSAGNVHLLVLGRLYSPEEDLGLIHLMWNRSEWSPPTRLYASSDPPEWPRIDVGMGNKVFATWFTRDETHITESERGRYKVWVASYQASAPLETPVPLPTRRPSPAVVTLGQATATPTTTPIPAISSDTSGLPLGLRTEGDDVGRLVLALSPIIAVLLVIVALRFIRFRRRR